MRLNGRAFVVLGAVLGVIVILATDQVVPATSQYQAQMRLWLSAGASGLCSYGLLTLLVALGLVLSHPVNQSTWKLSKRLFPWHEEPAARAAVPATARGTTPGAGTGRAPVDARVDGRLREAMIVGRGR